MIRFLAKLCIGILLVPILLTSTATSMGPAAYASPEMHLKETLQLRMDQAFLTISSSPLTAGVNYDIVISGQGHVSGGGGDYPFGDAEYAFGGSAGLLDSCEGNDIGIVINDSGYKPSKFPVLSYRDDHIYHVPFVGQGQPVNFAYSDCNYNDNDASLLTIQIFEEGPAPQPSQPEGKQPSLQLVDTLLVNLDEPFNPVQSVPLKAGFSYDVVISGYGHISGGGGDYPYGDAEFGFGGPAGLLDSCEGNDIGIVINDSGLKPSKEPKLSYREDHVYHVTYVGQGKPLSIEYSDCDFTDNENKSLEVKIYEDLNSAPKPPQPNQYKKFSVTFDTIDVVTSHDQSGSGHWDMLAAVNGKPIELLRSEGADNKETIELNNPADTDNDLDSPKSIEVSIPSDGSFVIETSGRERDRTSDDEGVHSGPSTFQQLIAWGVPKAENSLHDKYKGNLTATEKDIALYKSIVNEIPKEADSKWVQTFGHTASTGLETYAIFASQGIPVWGQVMMAGLGTYDLVKALVNVWNEDDGLGIIHKECSFSNNYCIGPNSEVSQYNGHDGDSAGDYFLAFTVKQIGEGTYDPAKLVAMDATQTPSPEHEQKETSLKSEKDGNTYLMSISSTAPVSPLAYNIDSEHNLVRIDLAGKQGVGGDYEVTLPTRMASGISGVNIGGQFKEVSPEVSDSATTIKFAVPENSGSVEIVAARVVPEFPMASLAAVAAVIGVIAVVGRTNVFKRH